MSFWAPFIKCKGNESNQDAIAQIRVLDEIPQTIPTLAENTTQQA